MRRGNKGEWSELYTFLKLLSEGKLYAADADLNKIYSIYYPLIKILREESGNELDYFYTDQMIVIEDASNESSIKMPISEFKKKSLLLLEEIKKAKGRSFSVAEIEGFLNAIKYDNLKAKASDKSDIRIMVHDPNTGMQPILGFSIKSRLGGASTLLNPGRTTNFVFEILGDISDEDMQNINKIEGRRKILDRIEAIGEMGFSLKFDKVFDKMFNLNLQVIDSRMPEILGEFLVYFYSGKGSRIIDLLEIIQKENPCEYNNELGHSFYEYKMKSFMRDVALGMVPSVMWSGEFDATGGYIVVKENGDVLCYHIYNHNEFQDYLLKNTKLETASTNRYEFAEVYREEGKYYIKLNLQIRFI